MLKRIKLPALCLLILLTLILAGCTKPPVKLPAAQALADSVLTGQRFNEPLGIKTGKLTELLGIKESDFTEAVMVMDVSRMTPECVIVLTAVSKEAGVRLEQALLDFKQALREQYINYRPEEVPKIEQALLRKKDLQQVLVISPDKSKAEASLDAAWK